MKRLLELYRMIFLYNWRTETEGKRALSYTKMLAPATDFDYTEIQEADYG